MICSYPPKEAVKEEDEGEQEGRDAVTIEHGVSEPSILQRYDGVVHMVTAADGAAPTEACFQAGALDFTLTLGWAFSRDDGLEHQRFTY